MDELNKEVNEIKKVVRKRSKDSLVLQARDFDIFIWLLDQKFSDLEVIRRKFFPASIDSLGSVRTRIQKLVAKGYLRSQHLDVGSTKKYYLATVKAYRETQLKYPSLKIPRAVQEVRNVTFTHDKFVLLSRIYLEEQNRAFSWKSERRLKSILSSSGQNIEREFMPDGIFTNKNGGVTAFELENTPKNYIKYQKKIERFVSIMNGANPVFKFCLYVTTCENTKNVLKKLTAPYSKNFLVQTFEELSQGDKVLKAESLREQINV